MRVVSRWAPVANWVLCSALVVAGSVLLILGPGRPTSNDLFAGVGGASMFVMAFAFASVGTVVARRDPGNKMGSILGVTGLITALGIAAYAYADHGLRVDSASLPGVAVAATVEDMLTPLVAGLLALSLLLFPDGRLPSRRWRPVLVATLIGMAVMVVGGALRPGPFDAPFAAAANPFGVPGTRQAIDIAISIAWPLMFAGLVAATFAARFRLRRAAGIERAQLKWVLAGGAAVGAVAVADMAGWFIWPTGHEQVRMAVIGTGFTIFPLVIGAAILRYRLYDIDIVINRALVYGSLTATLAATYLGGVLLMQLILRDLISGSGLAVAISTLATAALARPLRDRLQRSVDRRFFRERYDAAQTLSLFATRLRGEMDLDVLSDDLCHVAADTMRSVHVSLWLRDAPTADGVVREPLEAAR